VPSLLRQMQDYSLLDIYQNAKQGNARHVVPS